MNHVGGTTAMAVALTVALTAAARAASAQSADHAPGRDGLPGGLRVGFTGAAPSVRLTTHARAGYGFIEGADGEGGDHHRLLGTTSVALRLLPRMAFALGFDGRWDHHPEDTEGRDTSAVGVPWVVLRSSATVFEELSVGADVRWDVHGGSAPAFDPLGSRLTLRGLVTARPLPRVTVGVAAGFRFDGTGRTLDETSVPRRAGDRVSLDVTHSDAVVLGIAVAWTIESVEAFGELTWEPLVGPNAPALERAAGRFATGIRWPLFFGFVAELAAEVGFRSREPVQLGKLVEVEPRVTAFVGLSHRIDLGPLSGDVAPPADSRSRTPTPELEPAPGRALPSDRATRRETGLLRGLVRDFVGRPVLDASVRVDGASVARVDADGAFEVELEPGEHEVEVSSRRHASQRRRVDVEVNGVTILNVDLRRLR